MTTERQSYRIVYNGESPRFHLKGDRWPSPVADCSETGVCFVRSPDEPRVEPGDRVEGEMRFCNGNRVQVAGRVVRVNGTEVALKLDEEPIPFPEIMREQMYLRRTFQAPRPTKVSDRVSHRHGG
jgi:hypothetical protein